MNDNASNDSSENDKNSNSRYVKIWASRYAVVREAAQKLGWKVVDPSEESSKESVNILWVDTSNVNEYLSTIRPWQLINHFSGMINIARKAELAVNLEVMRQKFPDEYSFFPVTYVIPRDLPLLREQFSISSGKSKSFFIVKPAGGSQGKGIFITRTLKEVEELSSSHVCQKYITNPLLIDNKKFDLRIYILITSCDPLRVYIFKDGLVRLCTEDYSPPTDVNLHKKFMHLSNYSINKMSEQFDGTGNENGESGSKRSVRWLLHWIENLKGKQTADELWAQIGNICLRTIISILPTLVREYKTTFPDYHFIDEIEATTPQRKRRTDSKSFAILGFDILIDSEFQPHLIEVNHLPSFGTDTPLDHSIKLKVVQQALSILNVSPYDQVKHSQREKKRIKRRLEGYANSMNMEIDESDGSFRKKSVVEQVTEIYQEYAPEKLDKIESLISKYEGYEQWLLLRLNEKYVLSKSNHLKMSDPVVDLITDNTDVLEQNKFFDDIEGDLDFIREKKSLVEMGNYEVLYPSSNKKELLRLNEMISHADHHDKKQLQKLVCPLWKSRAKEFEMHDEYPQETLTRIHNEKIIFSSSRGDWLVHGNIHLKKVLPSQTKITAPPSKKRVEAANRLSKGFSVEDRDISVYKSIESDEHTGPAKRRVRQKCEEKLISKTQLLIRPITLQLGNESSSDIVSYRGDRCYVDFNGRKIRY
jgi:tubulin polyglutamylase TTLL6/13